MANNKMISFEKSVEAEKLIKKYLKITEETEELTEKDGVYFWHLDGHIWRWGGIQKVMDNIADQINDFVLGYDEYDGYTFPCSVSMPKRWIELEYRRRCEK